MQILIVSVPTHIKLWHAIKSPMLDRIDIHIEVPSAGFEKLSDNRRGEASADIRARDVMCHIF